MVTERCQTHEMLAAVSELAADDPRRAHLDSCPRCRARLIAYRAFLAGDLPTELDSDLSNLAAARNQIDKAVAQEIYGTDRGPAAAGGGYRGRWGNFAATAWRPTLALAAVLVLAFGLKTSQVVPDLPLPSPDAAPVLRGTVERSQFDHPLQVEPGLDHGSWLLAWEPPERTSTSTIVLYDTDLAEVARFDAGQAKSFLIQSEMIPAPEQIAFLRVVFDANGDEIGRSRARIFTF